MARTVLGLDIGGTKIAAGLVEETGRLVHQTRVPTPVDHPETTFGAVRAAMEKVLAAHTGPLHGIGVAAPGPVDLATGRVSPINIPSWLGFPLRDRIQDLMGDLPVVLAADGMCMALGEQWAGAGRGTDSLLGIVVSTGIGGGLVVGGRPLPGRTGNAGHVGHVVVETGDDAWPCTCGGRGCVETVASGPHLVRWARMQGWPAPDHADAAHLAAAARAGDEIPRAAFRRCGQAVALAIAAAAVICDLDLAVVGGGLAQAGELLFNPINETLAEHARLSFLDTLRVVPAELAGNAGLIGAAGLLLAAGP